MQDDKSGFNHQVSRRNFLAAGGAAMVAGFADRANGQGDTVRPESPSDAPVKATRPSRKQNIIIFQPDEMRADALSCYGNPITKTPNFDKLAKMGTLFENCNVQYPVCGASRCSMLTGWPTSVRGHRSLFYYLRPNEPNLFRYLKDAGYDVFWYGKNDALAAQSFYGSVTEWNYPKINLGHSHTTQAHNHKSAFAQRIIGPHTFITEPRGEPHHTGDYEHVQNAIRILERRESDRPFCIFLPLSFPHPPYGAPTGFYDMYKAADIHGLRPIGLPKRPSYVDGIRELYGLDKVPESTFRQVRALYYGMVSYSDWLMGHILEAVERTNHSKDTAILLLSDHADYAGDYGLVEKWPSGLEDSLTHVPLIAHVPGATEGHRVKNVVELFDMMATCLDLAQTEAQHTHFSQSLLPQIYGGQGDANRAGFCEGGYNTYEPQCFEPLGNSPEELYYPKSLLQDKYPQTISRAAMVRTHDYKLISRPQGQSELYIYAEDPHELNNRYGDKAVADIQHMMQQRLLHWYVNTTGIAPFDKDQRGLPPYYPTPTFKSSIDSSVANIVDHA